MGAARVRRLAARKKSDHSVGAVSDLMPLNSNVVLSGPENVFVLCARRICHVSRHRRRLRGVII